MWFVVFLNWMFVLLYGKLDYKYEYLFDMVYLKKCFGNSSVIIFEEFVELWNEILYVDRFICYMYFCYFDKDYLCVWEVLGYIFGE